VGDCDYWVHEQSAQWCDLTSDDCACDGSTAQCCIRGRSIAEVIRLEETATLNEAAARVQKRRHGLKNAS